MRISDENDVRCPYMAGEVPAKPHRLCAQCELARDPAAAGDLGRHLSCAFLERKKKRPDNGRKKDQKKKPAHPKPSRLHQKQPRRAANGKRKLRKRRYSDGYDGYYDDVLPLDNGGVRQGIDGELAKKIGILIAGVLLIVGVCVAVMYYV